MSDITREVREALMAYGVRQDGAGPWQTASGNPALIRRIGELGADQIGATTDRIVTTDPQLVPAVTAISLVCGVPFALIAPSPGQFGEVHALERVAVIELTEERVLTATSQLADDTQLTVASTIALVGSGAAASSATANPDRAILLRFDTDEGCTNDELPR